jgi:hypothetical protein
MGLIDDLQEGLLRITFDDVPQILGLYAER